jgi:ribulose-bisphosphate carboxylase large chain
MTTSHHPLTLSGERFTACYHLKADAAVVDQLATDICIEQTVEFPVDLIDQADIKEQIIGEVRSIEEIRSGIHRAVIAYPIETAGRELTQLLNVIFGNISLKPNIQLVSLTIPENLAKQYRGPRFGVEGLRELIGVYDRPLISTAIKPMGLSIASLAEFAYQFAMGGVDIIKDDHGLADQPFGRFEERVSRVAAAVEQANEATGGRCLYLPNITAPADEVVGRAKRAKERGAGGLLIAPGLVGLDTQRSIADDDDIALPLFSHPAFQGSFVVHSDAGITPGVLFATLNRLAGADAVIFPNFGGRFSFSKESCRDLALKARESVSQHIRPLFPAPAGGMSLDRIPEMRRFYGDDIVLLIGGDLRRHGESMVESARCFREAL